jgi:hypothetical protein
MSADPARDTWPQQAGSAARGAEPDESAGLEVVFNPAEPILDPGAARAVLDLLLRACKAAQDEARPEG